MGRPSSQGKERERERKLLKKMKGKNLRRQKRTSCAHVLNLLMLGGGEQGCEHYSKDQSRLKLPARKTNRKYCTLQPQADRGSAICGPPEVKDAAFTVKCVILRILMSCDEPARNTDTKVRR